MYESSNIGFPGPADDDVTKDADASGCGPPPVVVDIGIPVAGCDCTTGGGINAVDAAFALRRISSADDAAMTVAEFITDGGISPISW